jgi:hypothetical protein
MNVGVLGCAAYRGVEPAGVLGDACGLGHGDGAHGVRAGHRVAAGEFVVHAVGLGRLGPLAGLLAGATRLGINGRSHSPGRLTPNAGLTRRSRTCIAGATSTRPLRRR